MRHTLAVMVGLLWSTIATAQDNLEWDAWLNDKVIGTHTYTFEPQDDGTLHVRSAARYKVKVLFVTVFDYDHVAEEVWQGDCMIALNSNTTTNGESEQVSGAAKQDAPPFGFSWNSQSEKSPETQEVDACIGSYAYWRRDLLRAQMINGQTGELDDLGYSESAVTLADGSEGVRVTVDHPDGPILLDYDTQGNWMGLESVTNGRTLKYTPATGR